MLQLIAAIALMYLVVFAAGMWSKRRQQYVEEQNTHTG